MPLLVSEIKALIFSILAVINSSISFVEQLPLRIQMTFGGNPKKATRLLKSLSLVTIENPSVLANSHTTESLAASRLISCKCFESLNDFASLGVWLLVPNKGSLQEFLHNSFPKPFSPKQLESRNQK
jgi:hypothetical protein